MRSAQPGDELRPVRRLRRAPLAHACSRWQRPARYVRSQDHLRLTAGAAVRQRHAWRPLRDAHRAPSPQGFDGQQEIGAPAPFGCVVPPQRLTRLHRQAATGGVMKLFAGLIQANHQACRVVGSLIPVQPVFHRGDIRPRRLANAPGRYPPGLDCVF